LHFRSDARSVERQSGQLYKLFIDQIRSTKHNFFNGYFFLPALKCISRASLFDFELCRRTLLVKDWTFSYNLIAGLKRPYMYGTKTHSSKIIMLLLWCEKFINMPQRSECFSFATKRLNLTLLTTVQCAVVRMRAPLHRHRLPFKKATHLTFDIFVGSKC
jgi:hypothetical protein